MTESIVNESNEETIVLENNIEQFKVNIGTESFILTDETEIFKVSIIENEEPSEFTIEDVSQTFNMSGDEVIVVDVVEETFDFAGCRLSYK